MYLSMPAIVATVDALSSLCPKRSVLAMTYLVDAGGIAQSALSFAPLRLLFHIWLRFWAGEPVRHRSQRLLTK